MNLAKLSRRKRRIMAVFTFGSLLAGAALLGESVQLAGWLLLGISLAFLLPLLGATRFLTYRRAKHLDERESQLAAEAYQQGYSWALAIIIGWLVSEFVDFFPWSVRSTSSVGLGELIYWLGLMLIAPTLYLAWTQPDPLLEDELQSGEFA